MRARWLRCQAGAAPGGAIFAVVGGLLLFAVLVWPQRTAPANPQSVQAVSATLRGQISHSDVASDIYGFRALVGRRDAYLPLGTALRTLGIDWDVKLPSTHPPTCFLLLAPVAFMPWPLASAAWAWLMVGLLCLSFRFCGLRWTMELGLTPPALLWPPVAASLGQVTIVWLCGLAAAYHWRQRGPFRSGLGIGLAALTKLAPGIMVVVLLLRKQWRGVLAFVLVWTCALGALILMSPAVFVQYLHANRTTLPATFARPDNSALLATAFRAAGWPGVLVALSFLVLVIVAGLRRRFEATDGDAVTRLWLTFMYLAVALLPIAWVYSVTPLLPVMLYLLSRGRATTTLTAAGALAIPFFAPGWGAKSVAPLVVLTLLVGVGLIFDQPDSEVSASRKGRFAAFGRLLRPCSPGAMTS